ncbi:interleukin-5 receptor subunit alpha-like isoform X2 [Narcine bancroftii]|uniref:interleukin-5 receptor subunit alpha-like isoform X2 n=1 Tax=Narcine bancroftii TaxID=1343680 RepID=UPI00383210B4
MRHHSSCNQTAKIHNLSCLFYNNNHVNCTWENDETAPSDTQYTLLYRIKEEEISYSTHCDKIQPGKINCMVRNFMLNLYDDVRVCAVESHQHKLNNSKCIDIFPLEYYKCGRPVNIRVNETEVTWNPPTGKNPSKRFDYQIQIIDLDTNKIRNETLQKTKWEIKDLSKSYLVQVRARISHSFLEASEAFWSDWTHPIKIEREQKTYTSFKILIITSVTTIVIVLLSMFIYRRYKLREYLCQPIPDPKQKFTGLFENYNGEFQMWMNTHHPDTKEFKKCHTVIVEEANSDW